jgi:hypothetical protein
MESVKVANMKKLFIILTLIMTAGTAWSQAVAPVNFVNQLGDKKQATFGDAVTIYLLTLGKDPKGFNIDVQALTGMGILKDNDYKADTPLRRGMIANMVARHLKLGDSLFYNIFGTERYAFRACIAARLMEAEGSEWDDISGEELLEIMSSVEYRLEVQK